MTCGFPVMVTFVAVACGNFGGFLGAPGVPLTSGDAEGVQGGAGGGAGCGGDRV